VIDLDTFLTALYVIADDLLKQLDPEPTRPGPSPSLTRSEVAALALLGVCGHFRSERAFYGWARRHLRSAFPSLPDRSQFNRLCRRHAAALAALAVRLSSALATEGDLYEVVDTTVAVTRDRRRGGAGWLAGQADLGWSTRAGWCQGIRVLLSVWPSGVVTGFGIAPASTSERLMAETLFAARHEPQPQLPSAGAPAAGPYLMDTGFEGRAWHARWRARFALDLICPNKRSALHPWPEAARRWVSSARQIVETVNEKLLNHFGLARERPHTISGLQARLACRVALHNLCIQLNRDLGRPPLAFADLLVW
jgi:hypothetical protein